MSDEDLTAVRHWADEVADAIGIAPGDVDLEALLSIAGLSARAAVRPAAPVTTYLLGLAVGRSIAAGTDPAAAFAASVSAVRALAASRQDSAAGEPA